MNVEGRNDLRVLKQGRREAVRRKRERQETPGSSPDRLRSSLRLGTLSIVLGILAVVALSNDAIKRTIANLIGEDERPELNLPLASSAARVLSFRRGPEGRQSGEIQGLMASGGEDPLLAALRSSTPLRDTDTELDDSLARLMEGLCEQDGLDAEACLERILEEDQ